MSPLDFEVSPKDERAVLLRYERRFGELSLEKYPIIRETKCFYIVDDFTPEGKRVSKDARSRFAYPTEQEALKNLYYRKRKQIKIVKNILASAERDFHFADKKIKDHQ